MPHQTADTQVRVLVDVCHPAHAHFFRRPIQLLREHGHEVLVTSRKKEFATELLAKMGIQHIELSKQSTGSAFGMLSELAIRNVRLVHIARRFKPHVMTAIGGIFVSHAGSILRIPRVVFYDTENAKLQNILTYPFVTQLCVPDCYMGWTPKTRTVRYAGYHELSYLHPNIFTPNVELAKQNGLDPHRDCFLIRAVSWQSNHDIGERGWSPHLLEHVAKRLSKIGQVIISSEGALPDTLADYAYKGSTEAIHHVMAFCKGYVGESATMASESAILGVPAVYAAHTTRGYINELDTRYQLVKRVHSLTTESIDEAITWLANRDPENTARQRFALIEESIDVASFVFDHIQHAAKQAQPSTE